MTRHDKRNPDDKPDTALDEVLHEAEQAETRVTDSEKRRRDRGEAGDAITPNEQAQEESHHD
ncbi:hypothetical protein JIX56_02660 [Streptomyces sp. CA-210063]|uniref:hypothetical protein n=1 Tax=Streptomyces sp. CA-210063 TaxID=2801029 RepID=UPI00214A9853|nr:hypothetical protein [Streptomyces sp. CA-210063]UUU28888.1 hypothetical protein JIX56_02660 [Streptomyces sp. CA-210063]